MTAPHPHGDAAIERSQPHGLHVLEPARPAVSGHDRHADEPGPAANDADAGGALGHDAHMSDPAMAAAMERDIRRRFLVALLLTIPLVLISPIGEGLLGVRIPLPIPHDWAMLLLATPVVFWCGWMFLDGTVSALRRRTLDMNVLIATGVLAAWLASVALMALGGAEVFFEAAAMLVTFVLFGHWMEMKSRRGTTDALRALLDLVPPVATVVRDGQEVEVPTADILAGDEVVIRPGDRIPVDGTVLRGRSAVDESLVTGESLPIEKGPGDPVVGGSINGGGAFSFEATRVGADTALARIVDLVDRAQRSRAPGQRLADRAAQYLVVLAIGSGLVTFAAWTLFGNAGFVLALTFAISAVVIACPDALGLATPTAVAVGTGIAARHNILIKDAASLEGFAAIDTVVLDKTGTLTEGKPELVGIHAAPGWSEDALLTAVAGVERRSEHPLAAAIVAAADARGIALTEPEAFESIAGHGLVATAGGRTVVAGNRRLLERQGIPLGRWADVADEAASLGQTPMFVAVDGEIAGVLAVADPVKPGAREAVAGLKARGIEPVMISGDTRRTAEAVARSVGIERVFAETLPGDKAVHVERLQREGRRVAMVGDGVNDAPALAQADIGVAIGAGTDVAIETARVVLMRSDPRDILAAHTLSRATVRTMKQNLAWASVYNVLAIPVAAGVLYPAYGVMLRPEWSALLMSLSSIIVATNAVLLRRVEPRLVASAA